MVELKALQNQLMLSKLQLALHSKAKNEERVKAVKFHVNYLPSLDLIAQRLFLWHLVLSPGRFLLTAAMVVSGSKMTKNGSYTC